jgi:hypothetical protein
MGDEDIVFLEPHIHPFSWKAADCPAGTIIGIVRTRRILLCCIVSACRPPRQSNRERSTEQTSINVQFASYTHLGIF